MTKTPAPASSKQLAFLTTLTAERELPAAWAEVPDMIARGLKSAEASLLITKALSYPYIKKAEPSTPTASYSAREKALRAIPKSCYAVPFAEFGEFIPQIKQNAGNDLLFVEVREYKKRMYMRRLVGSVGDFSRYILQDRAVLSLAAFIKVDPLKYTQAFGEAFTVCGCCKAPLTDSESRRLALGPECRKRFGL